MQQLHPARDVPNRAPASYAWLLALTWTLAFPAMAAATEVGGGGGASKDCMITFDAAVNHPASRPRGIRCQDGDPACDEDGVVNGICEFDVVLCGNSTFDPRCAAREIDVIRVDGAVDDGSPRFDPEFLAVQQRVDADIAPPTTATDVCTAPVTLSVAVRGPLANGRCKKAKKTLRTTAETPPGPSGFARDKDKLRLFCEPASCDPLVLFEGTFDRIQRQIFDVSCAVSGCHDSESFAGGLLLESGSAYGALVGIAPVNAAAGQLGWLRVSAGDPDASFLQQKLEGGLDSPLGLRMPRDSRRLPSYLRELVELWILDGAPETGWSPGTD